MGRKKREVPAFWRRMSRREPFLGRRIRPMRRAGRGRGGSDGGGGDAASFGLCVVGGVDSGDSGTLSASSLVPDEACMEGLPDGVMSSTRARNLATMAL